MRTKFMLAALGFFCLFLTAWIVQEHQRYPASFHAPLGLPPIPWPKDNPYSPIKAELGRLLFFDKRLSTDESISCASCHSIPKGFGDPFVLATGIHGRIGTRHAPVIINAAFNTSQFWDGRAETLEEQAVGPIGNPNEMTLDDDKMLAYDACERKIRAIADYRLLFKEAFGREDCTMQDIAQAIATFERTLVSGNSAFDRYQAADPHALSPDQIRGFEIFKQSDCMVCHSGPNFTGGQFANIGIGMDKEIPDLGRYEVTQNPEEWGAFKVPTLREVSLTGPYMHDGSLKTLEDVVDYYNRGGIPNPNLDSLVRPLHLSEQDKKDLVQFLKSLNGEGWQTVQPLSLDAI